MHTTLLHEPDAGPTTEPGARSATTSCRSPFCPRVQASRRRASGPAAFCRPVSAARDAAPRRVAGYSVPTSRTPTSPAARLLVDPGRRRGAWWRRARSRCRCGSTPPEALVRVPARLRDAHRSASPSPPTPGSPPSDGEFSVSYPGPETAYEATFEPNGVVLDLLAGDGGTLRLFGQPANGQTPRQIADDLLRRALPGRDVRLRDPQRLRRIPTRVRRGRRRLPRRRHRRRRPKPGARSWSR